MDPRDSSPSEINQLIKQFQDLEIRLVSVQRQLNDERVADLYSRLSKYSAEKTKFLQDRLVELQDRVKKISQPTLSLEEMTDMLKANIKTITQLVNSSEELLARIQKIKKELGPIANDEKVASFFADDKTRNKQYKQMRAKRKAAEPSSDEDKDEVSPAEPKKHKL